MKRVFFVAAVFFSGQLSAQTTPANGVDTTSKTLDEIVITANKYPQKQSETGKVISVINRQQLEHSQGKTLGELLNTVAGVNIAGPNNTLGTNLTANIRGASSGNVLILVDGVPTNDPSTNTNYFDLNFFVTDQIERIEILKGGQSTLYGSDAVAAVINIITRRPANKEVSANAVLTAGSYDTYKEEVGVGGNDQQLNYSVNYSHLSSAGFSAAHDSANTGSFDRDGFDQHALGGNLTARISRQINAKLFTRYSTYNTDLDAAAFTDERDFTGKNKNLQAGVGFVGDHSRGSLHFNYLFNYSSRRYLDDSGYRSSPYVSYSISDYIGREHYAELYNNQQWGKWELLTGIDYRFYNTYQYSLFLSPFFPSAPTELKAKMAQASPYASAIYKNDNFQLEAGGRWNHHSEYGNNFTYTVNPSYRFKGVKAFLNLYSAYKTPTLYQLFDGYAGNKNLKPEKGFIGEAGFEIIRQNSFWLRTVGFYRDTKNVIDFITTNTTTFQSQYTNISQQKNYGAELEAKYHRNNWRVDANYTYTDGKTRSAYDGTGFPLAKDTTYYNLYRIPKHALNVSVGYLAGSFYGSALLHAVSKREEFIYGDKPVTMKAYSTIDLYGEYKLSKFKCFVDLKNITNQKYFDIQGYNTRRFNFTAGITFSL